MKENVPDKNEVILTYIGVSAGVVGLFTGVLSAPYGVGLIGLSFALYQGTSLAKIIKNL